MTGRRQTATRREPTIGTGPQLRIDPTDRPTGNPPQRKPASRNRGRKRRGSRRPLLARLAYWSAVLTIWCGIAVAGVIVWVGAHLPPIHSLEIPKRPPSISIVDRQARPIAVRGDAGGAVLRLKELPPHLPNAFIAIEDRRFYSHIGIDPFGIARAVMANAMRMGVSQGGSTITQQLAKNLFLTQERTVRRKLQEALLALWLEWKFSKAEILELYLNRIYFGSGATGIEQAAQRYFGKSARQIGVAEAALLAGIVKSPSRLAPTRDFDGAEKRARVVLAAMKDLGFIGAAAERNAFANPPRIVAQADNSADNYVADWVMDILNDLIGHIEQDLVVVTTIDSGLQAIAERALADELHAKGAKGGVEQGALIAMTPQGAVRALVGGRDYAGSQFNRAVAARRQPGSAFKPFVYLTALEHGLTPETVREDKPIRLRNWKPENYTREYFGDVTLTQALAMSLNTVSVRLTMEFGPMAVIRTAHRLGIASTLEPNASISLGTSEVTLLELTGAYAPLANGGLAVRSHVVDRVSTPEGKVLYQRSDRPLGRIVDPNIAAAMNAMMQETLKVGTAHKASLPGWQAAGKTGTSQDFRDAWFIGYTPHLVTGIWLGNDDNSSTKKVTGGGMPVEVWSRFMRSAHQGVPVAELPVPGGGLLSALKSFANAATGNALKDENEREPEKPRHGLDGWLIDNLFGRR